MTGRWGGQAKRIEIMGRWGGQPRRISIRGDGVGKRSVFQSGAMVWTSEAYFNQGRWCGAGNQRESS